MTHKIAIITTRDVFFNYGDDREVVIDSITEWEEVSDDVFKTLSYASSRLGFHIIEQPVDIKKFIAKTIADYTAIAKAEELRAEEEKKKREAAALARKFQRELKDRESKLRLLEKLQKEVAEGKLKP